MAQLVKVFHDKVLNYSDTCKKYLVIILYIKNYMLLYKNYILKIMHKMYLNCRLYILKLKNNKIK